MSASRILPPYSVRRSAKAKSVRLVITPRDGLTVVIPPGFDPALAPGIVSERLEWVTHHLNRVAALRQEAVSPPERVELRAVGMVLAVRYKPGRTRSVTVRRAGPSSIDVSGGIADRELVARGLRAWLKAEAGRVLPGMLQALSAHLSLPYGGVTIRLQRTRWGSCSSKGVISLNARLLFLPCEIAEYVLAHELAHTIHLNHSAEYWAFLESVYPGARRLDRELRGARKYLPGWA